MSNDEHATTPDTVPPKGSIVVGLLGLVLIAVGSVAIVLLVGGGLVWMTDTVGTWLDLPPMSMLIAVLGLSIIATVLVAQGRIVTVLYDTRWGPFEVFREHLERDDDRDDEDGGDDPVPVARRGRRRGRRR